MAPRDDLPTPEEFAADRLPNTPEVAPKPYTLHAPTIKAFSMSGKTSKDPAFGSSSMGGSLSDPSAASNTPSDPNHKPSPFVEIGASGLAQYGGFVREEFLPQLQGDRGLRVYREMYDNDPIVGALVFMIQMLMRKVEWRVEPPESPTVEGIVQARQKQRMQLIAEKNAEKQQQMMMAQAGMAGRDQGASFTDQSPTGATIAGPGTPPPKPSAASPLSEGTTPFHQPVPGLEGKTSPPAPTTPPAPVASNGQLPASGNGAPQATGIPTTPPSQPGKNPPSPVTAPGTNLPARPNAPGSNPSGGPNQAGALQGHDGLPGAPKEQIKKAWEAQFEAWWEGRDESEVAKASGSSGAGAGGIDAVDVGNIPTDPETGEPMDFPIGTGPLDPVSPEELHAMELAVFVETALHDMTDSWADTISQIVTMIVYGFALHELVYKKRNGPNMDDPVQGSRFADGKIGWAKIAGRAQETRHRWEFDEFGNVLGMWQMAPPKFQLKYIPLSKALLFRTTGYKQNPEGRALALDTPIPTPNGWSTMTDLVVGDLVYDDQGRQVPVVAKSEIWKNRRAYRLTFADGTSIVADENHEWPVLVRGSARTLSTGQIAHRYGGLYHSGRPDKNIRVPLPSPLGGPDVPLPVPPYALGAWLGDGSSAGAEITCHEDDEEVLRWIEKSGVSCEVSRRVGSLLKARIDSYKDNSGRGQTNPFHSFIRATGKRIPTEYLRASQEQRMELLRGLMDTDGTVNRRSGQCVFSQARESLVIQVAELARSLGYLVHVYPVTNEEFPSWMVVFKGYADNPPFHLSRKVALLKNRPERGIKTAACSIVSIEQVEDQDTICIEVDTPSHLFLAGTGMHESHNSILRSAYRPWYFKRRIEEIEAIGIERDLAGLPIAYVPWTMMSPMASPDEVMALNEVKNIVRNVRRDEQEGLVFPSAFDPDSHQPLFKFELLASPSRRAFDTDKVIARYDQRIAMVALIDFILLGHETVGSKALADTKVDLFTTALESWLNVIADVFNTSAIPRLMQINGEDPAMSPRLAFGKLSRISLTELSALITSMAGAGADLFPDTALEDFLREAGGLPSKAATDDL